MVDSPPRDGPPDFDDLPMRVGLGTFADPHDERLRFVKQVGGDDVLLNFASLENAPVSGDGGELGLQELIRLRNRIADAGLRLNAIENVPVSFYDDVMLGREGREEQIEHLQNTVRNVGEAGIPYFGYHWMPLGVWRTSMTRRIRGDAKTGAVDAAELADLSAQLDRTYSEEELWEYYEWFLERILPVAEEADVTLALHPHDPPVEELGGVPRLFRNRESFERAMALVPSDSHGLEFCLGNWAAMGADLPDVIEHFGSRDEIEYVHFQTIDRPLPEFHEVFVDQDGYYDPYEILATLHDVGFSGLIIPGHAPVVEGDGRWSERGRAFTVGYLSALLSRVEAGAGSA